MKHLPSTIEHLMAEGVGFEPTRAFALPVFKTGAINHSTTPPSITDSIVSPMRSAASGYALTASYDSGISAHDGRRNNMKHNIGGKVRNHREFKTTSKKQMPKQQPCQTI